MIVGCALVLVTCIACVVTLALRAEENDDVDDDDGVYYRLRKDVQIGRLRPDDDECAICLERPDGEVYRPRCGHAFCVACLKEWVRHAPRCPLCNLQIAVDARRAALAASSPWLPEA